VSVYLLFKRHKLVEKRIPGELIHQFLLPRLQNRDHIRWISAKTTFWKKPFRTFSRNMGRGGITFWTVDDDERRDTRSLFVEGLIGLQA
ncbi:MAG: hypothetical protein H8D67_13025, partial [Deltaproteobacteria bacterium]|nr:hypothetical protein [Deltaproteobacteria bacterium]